MFEILNIYVSLKRGLLTNKQINQLLSDIECHHAKHVEWSTFKCLIRCKCYAHFIATAPISLYYTVFSFCCNINKVYLKIFYVEAIMMSLTRSRFGTASPGILAICTHQSMTVKYCLYSDTLDAQLGEHIRHFLKCQIAHHSHFSPGLSLFIFYLLNILFQ